MDPEEGLRLIPPPWHRPTGILDLSVRSAILRHVAYVLDYTDGRRDWAADELQINKSTLWRWVQTAHEPRRPRSDYGKSRVLVMVK